MFDIENINRSKELEAEEAAEFILASLELMPYSEYEDKSDKRSMQIGYIKSDSFGLLKDIYY